MRILYFSRDYSTHDHRFLRAAASSRHEILYLRLQDDGLIYERRPLPEGVTPVPWEGLGPTPPSPGACLGAMERFERVLAETRPDLVHAGPIQSCAFMTALAGFRPLLAMSWGSDVLVDAARDAEHRWVTLYTLRRSDRVLCDCDAVRAEAKQYAPMADDRFVQLPWGIDVDRYAVATRAARDVFTVLSTRSWADVYDVETTVRAFARAHREEPRLRLVLVGDGPLATRIHEIIAEEHVVDSVRLAGRLGQNELLREYAAADVYVSSATSDGTSISLLEAMATGLPVIVTDAYGNREWAASGEGGWLAPPRDVGAFANAMLAAARLDDAARTRIARHNRTVVETRANWSRNVRVLLEAYDRLEAQPSA